MKSDHFWAFVSAVVLSLGACGETSQPHEAQVMYRDGKSIDANSEGARSVVRLELRNAQGIEHFYCSGILVHPNVILTAAHCVVRIDEFKDTVGVRFDPAAIKIQLSNGMQTTGTRADYPKNYAIAYSHVDGLDVGYIVLKEPAPADLIADVASSDEFKAWGKQGAAKGKGISFGKTSHSAGTAGVLNTLDVPFVGFFGPRKDPVTLEIRASDTPENQARPLEFMAGFDNVNACSGDSGGGLFISVAGKLKLAGITSRNLNAPNLDSESCALGTISTVYGSAEAALNWAKRSAPEAFSTVITP